MIKKERKKLRLENYDYSSTGYYFITICIQDFEPIFGEIKNSKMCLNDLGLVAEKYWKMIPNYYQNIKLHEFIIMPEHIHGIIEIMDNVDYTLVNVGIEQCSIPTDKKSTSSIKRMGLLSQIIKSYKEKIVKIFKTKFKYNHFKWQVSFYDRIIRDKNELENIRWYIKQNPANYQYP